jgi:hypothetical protein
MSIIPFLFDGSAVVVHSIDHPDLQTSAPSKIFICGGTWKVWRTSIKSEHENDASGVQHNPKYLVRATRCIHRRPRIYIQVEASHFERFLWAQQ